ncbi:hypothetical protein Tco_0556809 [Tanacetum coccineum]
MSWSSLMKMMTEAYCSMSEIKKLKIELWNLTVKESDKVEKYTGGLPDSIQGNVMSARLKTLQEVIELANDLMDQKVRTYAARKANNKRHYKSDCPELKNQGRGNQSGNGEARGRVYALGGGESDQDPNDITNYIDA